MRGCGNGVLETQVGFLFFFFFEIPLAGRRKMTAGITTYMVKKSVRIRAPTRAQIHYPCFPIPLAYYEYSYSAPRWTLPPERKLSRYFAFSRAYDNKEWIWA